MSRAKHIIDTCMPTRCATRPDDFRCKACKAHALCWHTAKEFVDSSVQCTCRTCCHATADTEHEGANWTCRLGHSCSTEKTGCEDHLLIPLFINAEIKDGTNSSITFTTDEGEFTIGKGGFTIDELKHFGKDELKGVLAVKDGNTGASVVSSNTLERKYADRNRFGIYFSGSVKELNEECANHVSINFNKPIRSEEFGGKSYYEYEDDVLVIIDKDNATILMENPPF